MLGTRLPDRHPAVRLLGVGVSGLDSPNQIQRTLFDDESHVMQSHLDQAADQIRGKFGSTSISRASSLLHGVRHTPQMKSNDPPIE